MWYCTTRGTLSTPLHRAPNLLHHTCDMTHLWYFNYSCDMTHSWYSISSITQSSKSTSPRVWHDSFVVLYVRHRTGLLSQIEYLSSTISPPSPSPYRDPNLLHHTCEKTGALTTRVTWLICGTLCTSPHRAPESDRVPFLHHISSVSFTIQRSKSTPPYVWHDLFVVLYLLVWHDSFVVLYLLVWHDTYKQVVLWGGYD